MQKSQPVPALAQEQPAVAQQILRIRAIAARKCRDNRLGVAPRIADFDIAPNGALAGQQFAVAGQSETDARMFGGKFGQGNSVRASEKGAVLLARKSRGPAPIRPKWRLGIRHPIACNPTERAARWLMG